MAKMPQINVDFKEIQEQLKTQFSGLDPNDPSQWPAVPRNLLYVAGCVAVIAGLWFAWLKASDEELLAEKPVKNNCAPTTAASWCRPSTWMRLRSNWSRFSNM